eukprot:2842487-Rhodomonas_salina.2
MSTTVVALVSLTRLIAFDLGKSRDVDEIDHHHHADSGSGSLSVETRMSVLRTDIDGGGLCKRSASMPLVEEELGVGLASGGVGEGLEGRLRCAGRERAHLRKDAHGPR